MSYRVPKVMCKYQVHLDHEDKESGQVPKPLLVSDLFPSDFTVSMALNLDAATPYVFSFYLFGF